MQTEPPGAEVTIAGKKLSGVTPIDIEYKAGKYKIEITKIGYETIKDTIQVRENSPNKFHLEMESLYSSLEINPAETEMDVLLDGKFYNQKTPCLITELLPRKYTIELIGDKYYLPKTTNELKAKEAKIFSPKLIEYSSLTIKTSYKCSFKIGDKEIQADVQLKLKKGSYKIIPSLEYLDKHKITLSAGEKKEIIYDEILPKRSITLQVGNTPTKADFFYKDANPQESQELVINKENMILPGIGMLTIKNKYLKKQIKIDQPYKEIKMDITSDICKIIKRRKKTVKSWISICSAVVLIFILYQIIILINHNQAWKETKKINTIESYENYLLKYPKSNFKVDAFVAQEPLLWERAKTTNSLSSCQDYIKKFPSTNNSEQIYNEYPQLESMVFVQGGSFQMGSNDGDIDEKPVHSVTVSDFFISKTEVTQKEWKEVMGNNPSNWKGDNLPVESISWYDAVEFCNKKSDKVCFTRCYSGSGTSITCNVKANGYRLPTEAEWEYAARGGVKKQNSTSQKYSGSNNINEIAWYYNNSNSKTHSVGSKKPNELGIYDMSGNVREWCNDWYARDYNKESIVNNPQEVSSHRSGMSRGGSCEAYTGYCRVANRQTYRPDDSPRDLGFRLLRSSK